MFLIASCVKQLEPKPRAELLATYDARILLATFDNFRMNTRSGRYGAAYNMVGLLLF
jgi:hypothetical protein